MSENTGIHPNDRVWRNSSSICALADRERHLGHVLRVGRQWHAFDATQFNEESNGFRELGSFASLSAAKDAVGQSLALKTVPYAAAKKCGPFARSAIETGLGI